MNKKVVLKIEYQNNKSSRLKIRLESVFRANFCYTVLFK